MLRPLLALAPLLPSPLCQTSRAAPSPPRRHDIPQSSESIPQSSESSPQTRSAAPRLSQDPPHRRRILALPSPLLGRCFRPRRPHTRRLAAHRPRTRRNMGNRLPRTRIPRPLGALALAWPPPRAHRACPPHMVTPRPPSLLGSRTCLTRRPSNYPRWPLSTHPPSHVHQPFSLLRGRLPPRQ